MNLRLKIVLFFSLSLIIGYIVGIYSTMLKTEETINKARYALASCDAQNAELNERLDSLCGPALLKFVPCENGLEICVCGDVSRYLENTE